MKFLITIKHWQLFLFLTIYGFWPFESSIFNSIKYLGIALFVLWAFAIGYYGQKELTRLNLKGNNLYGIVSCLIFILLTLITSKFYKEFPLELNKLADHFLPILILIALIAALYIFFFAAKTLAKIEFKDDVVFDDYFSNFLLIGIPIIGIWTLQPKINRLMHA